MFAVLMDSTKMVKLLTKLGVNIKKSRIFKSESGIKPFHLAAIVGNENMVRLLLKKGVNIEDDFYGYSALHAAAISDGEIFFLEKKDRIEMC